MRPELDRLLEAVDAATSRGQAVAARAGDARWNARPFPSSWSVAECIDHLNRSAAVYEPVFDEALRSMPPAGSGTLRRDFMGWLLCFVLEPPARFKSKTPARFVPPRDLPARDKVMERFQHWQDYLVEVLRRSDGLAVDKVRVVSPFADRVRYSVYSALHVIVVHERRHLWQAERALEVLETA